MNELLPDKLSLNTFYILIFGTGIILFLWGILKRGIKAGPLGLPPIARTSVRVVVLFIALGFICFGGGSFWISTLKPPPRLRVLTGMAEEELSVFKETIEEFEKIHNLIVQIDNVDEKTKFNKLQNDRIDLLMVDINKRFRPVREHLLEELSHDKWKGLIPSAVNPIMLKYLKIDDKRYYVPYRPNVQILLLNRQKFSEKIIKNFKTWRDLLNAAKKFKNKAHDVKIVIQAADGEVHHTLFQIIKTAGGNPLNLMEPQTKEALRFIQELCQYIFPKSSKINWQTATGYLLLDDIYLVRNWTFCLSIINHARRKDDFATLPGLSWTKNNTSKPFNLLGGELLGLPKNARYKDLAIELMKYLMSRKIQNQLVTKLYWPAMRLDALGTTETLGDTGVWFEKQQKTINKALMYAEPLPYYFELGMEKIYRELFYQIKAIGPEGDIDIFLHGFQKEICQLNLKETPKKLCRMLTTKKF